VCATQDVLRDEDAPANARARGDEIRVGLLAIQKKHAWIGDVRGMGLMQALEIVKDPKTREPDAKRTGRFMEATREEGVLVGSGGLHGNVVRIGPSLLITKEELAEGIEKLARAAERSNG
jgi:4-aminobutyrate aminotransferase-like enzyme